MAFFQDSPTLGNQYDEDRVLRATLRRLIPADALGQMEASLHNMGGLAAGSLLELGQQHRAEEPQHIPYDPWGNRIDEVTLNPAWQHYAEVATREGLIATAYERKHGAHSRLHQFALVYLFDRSSQVYTCPLAMTDGAARTLEMLGSDSLKNEAFARLTSRDPAVAWTSGQWMTERIGGSDVGASECVARKVGDGWGLWGAKWFTSAVTADMALTLARPEGNGAGGKGLALFYVKVRDAEGRLCNIQVNRLKDKLGTKNLPTAELELLGTPAQPLAGTQDGVRNMRYMLNITRTWNAVCSVSGMRRALALARAYAGKRSAFGAQLSDKPLHLDTLAGMAAEYEAAAQLAFNSVRLLGLEESGEASERDQILLRITQPLAKLVTAKQAVEVVGEGIEAFGGAGYVEDTGLPELMRDAHVLPIWEGTTNVLALETYRSLQRTDGLRPFVDDVKSRAERAGDAALRGPAQAAVKGVEHAAHWLSETANQPEVMEAGARRAAMTLGRSLALALLCEHAQWSIDTDGDRTSAAAAQRFASHGVDLIRDVEAWDATRPLALDEAR